MPPFDRQEKTLVYRVELDESSLAQSIRTARETVGVGLSQAVDQAAAVGQAVNLTAATAAARIGSHLEFMERTRQVLAAPEETRASAHGLGVMRALGVKAGVVSPRFSETQASLESRADRELLGDPTGVKGLQRASTLMNVANFAAGIGLMFTGVGAVPGALLTVGSLVSQTGADIGFDRAISKRMLAGHMRDVGMDRALAVSDEFERYIMQQRVPFKEAMEVGQAALASMPRAALQDPTRLRNTLISAVETWGQVGKAFGMEKEEALAATTELFGLGIDPIRLRNSSYIGGVGQLANRFGINAGAMNAVGMDVMRQAMVGGYDALSAGNLFQLQTQMVAQMTRSGVLSRGDLAMAAGFSGPQSEMQLAASKNLMAAGMRFRETGFGNALAAGIAMGGQGDYMQLMARASTMSTQQMLEWGSQMPSGTDLMRQNFTAAEAVRSMITQVGGEATPGAVEMRLMDLGYDRGTARMMSRVTRTDVGVAQFGSMANSIYTSDQANPRAGFGGFWGGMAARRAGHSAEGFYGSVLTPIGHGFEFVGRWGIKAPLRKIWGDWEIDPIEGFRTGVATGDMAVALTTQREASMRSPEDLALMREQESGLLQDFQQRYTRDTAKFLGVFDTGEAYQSDTRGNFIQYLRKRQSVELGQWFNEGNNRGRIASDINTLSREEGVQFTQEELMKLMVMRDAFNLDFNQLPNDKAREVARSDFTNKIAATFGRDQADAGKLMRFALSGRMESRIDDGGLGRGVFALQERLLESTLTTQALLGDKESRQRIAGMLFDPNSASFRELVGNENIRTQNQLIEVAQKGFNAGDVNRQFVVKGMDAAVNTVNKAMAEAAPQLAEKQRSEAAEKTERENKQKEIEEATGKYGNRQQGEMIVELRETNRILKQLVMSGQLTVGAPTSEAPPGSN
jgi:hypothetical protein